MNPRIQQSYPFVCWLVVLSVKSIPIDVTGSTAAST